ncbi:MAG: multicopper oxidase domain-containing protein [Anaerolineales bacterium]|nr:multicopper oxidase domain-containing protein [Anaerolineales bacterium]
MKTQLFSPPERAAFLQQSGQALLLAVLLAFGVVAWQHFVHFYILSVSADSLTGHLRHILGDGLLALLPALAAVLSGLGLARRLGVSQQNTWPNLLQRAALISVIFVLLMLPLVSLGSLIDPTLIPVGISVFGHQHGQELAEGYSGMLYRLRDTLVGQAFTLPLVLLALAGLTWPRRSKMTPRRPGRSSASWLPPISALPTIILTTLFVLAAGWQAAQAAGLGAAPLPVPIALDNSCGGPQRVYNVSAIKVDITLNRFGDHDPDGFMYTLDENIPAVRAQEASRTVSIGLRKDPIQPLVIRANLGDCLVIHFTNRLSSATSLNISGLPYTVDSAAGKVGKNSNSFAAPGQSVTYRFPIPTAPEVEGAYYFRSHGLSRQQTTHGLFGAVVIEPRDSQYLDPETGQPLNGSNWEAIIVDPHGINFREFVIFYHEIGDDDYRVLDKNNNQLPIIDDTTNSYKPGSRGLNYRSEPFRNRMLLKGDKSQAYGSYMFGDPTTPIPRSYLGEPSKTRLLHGGSELFHVHHLHGGGDRWRQNPHADDSDLGGGLRKTPVQNAQSIRLDSQTIGPTTSFSLEHECGAGGCQQSAGDFLFHCHIGPHYVAGMWSFWRVFDTAQPDLARIPDRPAAPQAVNSLGLIGRMVEGKTLVPRASLTNPNAQRALEDWVEAQLPPQGVPLDDEDSTVWNWQLVYVNNDPTQPLYLGEPETTAVWANYQSPTPGQRPEIKFNPLNGRYAFPLMRPHLGQRPPFAPNGHTGAPWLGENGSAERPDGLCPTNQVVPSTQTRYYPITAIDLPIQVTKDKVDPDGMIFVLNEDKAAVRAGQKPAQPLTIRSNVGDCVRMLLTSEQEDAKHLGHAKVNMHTHFVQFDPQASDGVITGMSFEQSVRPYTSENRTLTKATSVGATTIRVSQVNRLRPGIFIGIGLGQGMCNASGQPTSSPNQSSRPCTEIRKIKSINGTTITLDQPLVNVHASGQAVGVEFAQSLWFSDVDSGTIFWHAHVTFHDWYHGLFATHIIEPAGSTYHDPVTGAEVRSGTVVDIHTSNSAGWGESGSFREFMIFIHNGNPSTGVEAGSTINLRAEPFDRRGNDPSLVFSSVKFGDPATPLLRAYLGDPVVFRGMGAVEKVGGLRVTGHRWREERFAGGAESSDTIALGISDHIDLILEGGAGGPAGKPGDYLYYSTVGRDFVGGAWGIFRVFDKQQSSLKPLPGHTPASGSGGFPQQSFTGGNPVAASGPGNVCPTGATVRSYETTIFETDITYFTSGGGTDSGGVMYALAADEQAILSGQKPTEPLVLRVNAGECLEIGLTNHLGERASLNLGELLFDPQGSYGAAIGYNADSTVAPNQRRVYRFYADRELGTSIMLNLAHPQLGARGAFGAVIVEPAGSVYRDPYTGNPVLSGTHADIISTNTVFREDVMLFQDEDERLGQNTMPYHVEVEGFAAINYRANPLEARLSANSDPAKVFDSQTHGDPANLFEVYAGDPIRYRVALPWGEQDHVFGMEGHRFPLEPYMPGAAETSARKLLPGEAYEAWCIDGGGGGILSGGDYLYGDVRAPFTEAGLWGLMRVYPAVQPHLLPLPVPGANQQPLAQNDTATTMRDSAVTIPVLTNDSDPDNNPLTVAAVTSPANGTAIVNGMNVVYTPNAGFTGADSFSYTISDGNGGSASATVAVTVNAPPPNPLYLSVVSNGTVGNLSGVSDEDILHFDGSSFSMVFDGSDVGVGGVDVDGFYFVDADTILMSFDNPLTLGSLGTVDDSDIVQFDATSLGETTAGAFTLFFKGANAQLTTSGEDVDAIELLADGRLLVSTTASFSVNGASGVDADLIAFTPATAGNYSSGTWAMYFDGSDVGLADAAEDVSGADVADNGDIYLTTVGAFAVSNVSGVGEDAFICKSPATGSNTTCAFDSTLYFDGSAWGLSGNYVDGINLAIPSGNVLPAPTGNTPPVLTITSPADGTSTTAGAPINFTATATDTEQGDLSAGITWTSDLSGTLGVGSSLSLTTLGVGTHRVTASVTDIANLSGSAMVTVTITAAPVTPTNTAPALTITSPAGGATFEQGATVSLAATATDAEQGDLSSSITWSSDVAGALGTGGSLSLDTLVVGTHQLSALVTDDGGLSGSATVSVTITAPAATPTPTPTPTPTTTPANTAPVVTLSSPAEGASFEEGATVSLSGSATDAEEGDLSGSIAWSSDVAGALGTGGSLSLTTLGVGTHHLTASVTDSGGQTGSASVTVNITSPAPPPPATETVTVTRAEFRAGKKRWIVEGTSSTPGPGNTITIYVGSTTGGTVIGTAEVSATGAWTFDQRNSAVAPDSSNTISVESTGGAKVEGVSIKLN